MRKLTKLFLVVAAATAATMFSNVYAYDLRGDLNGDGVVNVSDVSELYKIILGVDKPTFDYDTIRIEDVEFVMAPVEGGTFKMGYAYGQNDQQPIRRITLSPFKMSATEVTQELWVEVMGSNPSYKKDPKFPVHQVTWNEVQQFIKELNTITGKSFRLPTEAEWEYAAKGGNISNGYIYPGGDVLNEVAWNFTNSNNGNLKVVATKKPNELGLYDMAGNVCEWCSDWYGTYLVEGDAVSGEGYYNRINTLAELQIGAKYLIVCEDNASSIKNNNEQSTNITLDDGTASLTEDSGVNEYVLGGTAGAYTLSVGDNYLQCGTSGTSLSLKATPSDATLAQWDITFSGNEVSIVNKKTSRKIYAYQEREFRGYTSPGYNEVYPIQLYKKTATTNTTQTAGPYFDPQGPAEGTYKVYRGGSIEESGGSDDFKPYYRRSLEPTLTRAYMGFRLVLDE